MKQIYIKDSQGKKISVEVSDEIAKSYQESLQEEWRSDSYASYYTTSLDKIIEAGHDFEDTNANIEEQYFDKEIDKINKSRLKILYKAIDSLLPEQKNLIIQIYFKGVTQRKIAEKEGVDESAISKRMERIYKRLKNFFEKNAD